MLDQGVPILGETLIWTRIEAFENIDLLLQLTTLHSFTGAIKGEGLSDTLCIVVRYFGKSKCGNELV